MDNTELKNLVNEFNNSFDELDEHIKALEYAMQMNRTACDAMLRTCKEIQAECKQREEARKKEEFLKAFNLN